MCVCVCVCVCVCGAWCALCVKGVVCVSKVCVQQLKWCFSKRKFSYVWDLVGVTNVVREPVRDAYALCVFLLGVCVCVCVCVLRVCLPYHCPI